MTSALQEISPAQWKAILERLTIYAYHKTLRLHWETPAGSLSQGYEPKDLAFGAIVKVLQGERQWDPGHQDLYSFLKSVVDSMTSHLVSSPDNSRRTRNSTRLESTLSRMPTLAATPEEDAVASDLVDRMREIVADEPELRDLFERIRLGQKPQEIARDLRHSPEYVYNLIRKLKRHLVVGLELRGQASKRA